MALLTVNFRCEICDRALHPAAGGRCASCAKIMCRRHLWIGCPDHSLRRRIGGWWRRTTRGEEPWRHG